VLFNGSLRLALENTFPEMQAKGNLQSLLLQSSIAMQQDLTDR